MSCKLIMPETAAADLGPIITEEIAVGSRVFKILRPAAPERLLDLQAVEEAYAVDEYMPYWATIWPVSIKLADVILAQAFAPGSRAIEIGCGLGLPGLAALMAGLEVTFSDYDQTAVRFAGENARLNGFKDFKLLPMDWRDPITERYDVVIASDLIYEARLVDPIVVALDALLADHGLILLADQNRAYAKDFQQKMQARGFVLVTEPFERGTIYHIRRS